MAKKGSVTGEVDVGSDFDPDDYDDEEELLNDVNHALRKNGLSAGYGNTIGIDGDKIVVYGDIIYDENKDRQYRTGDGSIDRLVSKVKGDVLR